MKYKILVSLFVCTTRATTMTTRQCITFASLLVLVFLVLVLVLVLLLFIL